MVNAFRFPRGQRQRSRPLHLHSPQGGREVDIVPPWFESGKAVKASAAKNEGRLLAILDTVEGARYLGEFAFGANQGVQRFTENILFDEKTSGTVHIVVGTGFPETGS